MNNLTDRKQELSNQKGMKSLKALVVSLSDLSRDPRVERQLHFLLHHGATVTTAGFGAPSLKPVTHLPIRFRKLNQKLYYMFRLMVQPIGLLDKAYWYDPLIRSFMNVLVEGDFDFIVVNDIEILPLIKRLYPNAKIMFDAHEYCTRELEDQWKWRLIHQPIRRYLCEKYLPKADLFTTVCPSIADEYAKEYGVEMSVVTNAPRYQDLTPTAVESDKIRMIYQGGALRARKIEQVFDVMDQVDDRFQLDMILVPGDQKYIDCLAKRIEAHPKIQLVSPVPMLQIPVFCNQYDLGFFPLYPTNFNYLHALPNKFFEFIQARIPPIVSAQPDMAALLEQYKCGIAAQNFSTEAMVHCINKLTSEKIMEMKENCNHAARELCAERNAEILDRLLSPILRPAEVF